MLVHFWSWKIIIQRRHLETFQQYKKYNSCVSFQYVTSQSFLYTEKVQGKMNFNVHVKSSQEFILMKKEKCGLSHEKQCFALI